MEDFNLRKYLAEGKLLKEEKEGEHSERKMSLRGTEELEETDSTSPYDDTDFENGNGEINTILKKYGKSEDWFIDTIIKGEELRSEELDDLDYMEELIQLHLTKEE